MGSSYKEATHNNNVLYYKLHGLVSNMKIVKFYKPNQILILFFLWHIDLYFQLKKKNKQTAKQIILLSMVQLIILLILKAEKDW